MLNQKIVLRILKADNPPQPEGEDSPKVRFRGDLVDSVETVEYEGAVFPIINYTDRTAMVEIRDFETGLNHFHFAVIDVHVEPLDGTEAQISQVKARRG